MLHEQKPNKKNLEAILSQLCKNAIRAKKHWKTEETLGEIEERNMTRRKNQVKYQPNTQSFPERG